MQLLRIKSQPIVGGGTPGNAERSGKNMLNVHSARGYCLSLLLLMLFVSLIFADEAMQDTVRPQSPDLVDLVRFVIIQASADGYVSEKYWNKTSERFDGLRIRGLRISKRKKAVRHGFCRRYAAALEKPEANFALEIEDVKLPGEDLTAFAMTASLKARCEATFAHYVYGVKGVNGTTIAHADLKVRILISIDPRTQFSLSDPIPKIQLNARVRNVDLWLTDVDVKRIGVLDGKFVEILGDGAEEAIEELIQNQEGRLNRKLQKELDDIQGESQGPN